MFLLLILTYFTPFSSASIVDFEHINVSWVIYSIFKFYGESMHEAHISIVLKMVENNFFLDSEHVRMGGMPPPPRLPKRVVCLFMLYAWFLKLILLGYNFFVAAIIRYAVKVYK